MFELIDGLVAELLNVHSPSQIVSMTLFLLADDLEIFLVSISSSSQIKQILLQTKPHYAQMEVSQDQN